MRRKAVSQKARYTDRHIYLGFAARSVIVTFLIEILNRGSILSAFSFLTGSFAPFLCNALVIFTSLSVSRMFGRRRRFFADLFTLLWLFFGIINAIVRASRMTPFSAEDFSMVPSLFRIAKNYLTPVMIAGIIAGLAAMVALIVLMWLKVPKVGYQGRFLAIMAKTAVMILSGVIITRLCINAGLISNEFENLASAYDKYGFAYCFVTSIVDVGIDRPRGYSDEMMHGTALRIRDYVGNGLEEAQDPDAQDYADLHPNIIMIQLESFFDPMYLKGFKYSQDPIPCFRQIRDEFQSGFFTVPVVGAGTSNTEFEILTGMSTDYLGAGEYPYNTILTERTVEALPRILRPYGYRSTAIHNNTGTFYNRNIVFSQMGFDAFIPEEYMYDLELTPTNWARDKVLTQIMLDVLEESSQRDFIYTITVQSHGRYPQEQILSPQERVIRVKPVGGEIPVEPLEYYVNEIYEVDRMVEELTQALQAFDEPTVLVMYGDHLPALGFGAVDLKNGDLYETEYVIWNNFGMSGEDKDLATEQIGTVLLRTFGMVGGIMPRFHIACESNAYIGSFPRRGEYRKQYKADLAALEYDMLYGDGYIFYEFADLIEGLWLPAEAEKAEDGKNSTLPPGYWPSSLKIAYKPIRVKEAMDGKAYLEELSERERLAREEGDEAVIEACESLRETVKEDALIVRGAGFNECSKIMVDNKAKETVYLAQDALMLAGDFSGRSGVISVGQFDENFKQLGKCVNLLSYPQLGRPAR